MLLILPWKIFSQYRMLFFMFLFPILSSRSLSSHRIHYECTHQPSRTTQKAKTRNIYKCLCSDDSCDEISSCRSHSLIQNIGQDAGLSDEELTNEESSNIIAEIKYEKKMLEEQMKVSIISLTFEKDQFPAVLRQFNLFFICNIFNSMDWPQ